MTNFYGITKFAELLWVVLYSVENKGRRESAPEKSNDAMEAEFRVKDVEELDKIAGDILNELGNPGPVSIYGDLGAGKTTLVKALCAKLGVTEAVSSPTFSLHNIYLDGNGREVFHMDLYRLKDEDELIQAGIAESLEHDYWVFIEWPKLAEPFLQTTHKTIKITTIEGGIRKIRIL